MQKTILYIDNRSQYFVANRLSLARAVRDAGAKVHVATVMWRPEDAKLIRAERFTFHTLSPKPGNPSFFASLMLIPKLRKLYRQLKPDLIHLFTLRAMTIGGLAMYFVHRAAVIMSITGLGYTFTSNSIKAHCLRGALHVLLPLLLKRSRPYIVFQNRADLALLRDHFGLSQAQLYLIKGSGVDTNAYQVLPENEGEVVVVLASRMLRDKGIFEFVEAATELKSQGVQARFILVGDVDPENLATLPLAQLQGWHESGVIEWWGYCRDMLSVFSRTHIVCLPSYREGVPKVLIEAASCGRPIIATNVPGCQEIVRHGENGFLVPVKNSKALADALSRLLSNKVLRQAMGRKGRALVEQEFSLERVIEATFKMYRSLIDLGER